jgi:hypothetical protein
MALHCASRLGILDRVYQSRNNIAYVLGLIKEVPIAMCSVDYDFNQSLQIKTDDSSQSLPSTTQAREINLFFATQYSYPQPQQILLYSRSFVNPTNLYGLTIVSSIFHPPAV